MLHNTQAPNHAQEAEWFAKFLPVAAPVTPMAVRTPAICCVTALLVLESGCGVSEAKVQDCRQWRGAL